MEMSASENCYDLIFDAAIFMPEEVNAFSEGPGGCIRESRAFPNGPSAFSSRGEKRQIPGKSKRRCDFPLINRFDISEM